MLFSETKTSSKLSNLKKTPTWSTSIVWEPSIQTNWTWVYNNTKDLKWPHKYKKRTIEKIIGKGSTVFLAKFKRTLWIVADCFSHNFSNKIRNKNDSLMIMPSKKGKFQNMSISITTKIFSIMKVTDIESIRIWKIVKHSEQDNSKGSNFKRNASNSKIWNKLKPSKDSNTKETLNTNDLLSNKRKCVTKKNTSWICKSLSSKKDRQIAESLNLHLIIEDITQSQILLNIILTIHTFWNVCSNIDEAKRVKVNNFQAVKWYVNNY